MSEITEAPFEMANLPPRLTGLPMIVWVSERGNATRDVRVKICHVHGERMQWNNTASVAVRPQPHLVAGQLSPADLAAVSDWIRLNDTVLVDLLGGADLHRRAAGAAAKAALSVKVMGVGTS